MSGIMFMGLLIAIILFILIVPYLSAGKDKDFNKFMGNFRN